MSNSIQIDGRSIGVDYAPYVIAELSANHNGSFERAQQLITIAAEAGADAVKLQTYRPDTITLNSDAEGFVIKGGLWSGRRLYDLYAEAMLPWEWHAPLFEHARKCGITIFSSPFDATAIDLLETLNAPAYKIASFEAVDLPLIEYAASTGKPLIISTGMADAGEIAEAVECAQKSGCKDLAILHCISGYPTPIEECNLRTISDMSTRFGLVTGLSDHTLDNTAAIAAVALGASIIEKHFTLSRNDGGPDDSFSLEPLELKKLCRDARSAWSSVGRVDYGLKSSERGNVQFRRSLYYVKSLSAGDTITSDAIRSVRPGFGAAPKHWNKIIGMRVKKAVSQNTPVRLDEIDGWPAETEE